jgi:hypothetical protein
MSNERLLEYGEIADYQTSTKYCSNNGGVSYSACLQKDFAVAQGYYKHLGYDVPHYHRRLHKKELIPMTLWKQSNLKGSILESTEQLTIGQNSSYWVGPRPLLGADKYFVLSLEPNDLGLDETEMFERARGYVQDAAAHIYTQGWDALTWAAELHKTFRMFRRFVPNLLRVIRRGRLDQAWLESRYGWRLLLFDIQDIMKVIASLNKAKPQFLKHRIGSNDLSQVITEQVTASDAASTAYFDVTTNLEVSIRGNVIADIKPPKIALNPITTAWELVPFSFVVDWFIDVGQWLETLSFLSLSSKHVASIGYYIAVTRQVVQSDNQWKSGWSGARSFSSLTTGNVTVRLPASVPQLPQFGLKLSAYKITDLIALVLQVLRRK